MSVSGVLPWVFVKTIPKYQIGIPTLEYIWNGLLSLANRLNLPSNETE